MHLLSVLQCRNKIFLSIVASPSKTFSDKIIELVENNIQKMEDIRSCSNKYYFIRLFKDYYGITPKKILFRSDGVICNSEVAIICSGLMTGPCECRALSMNN